MTYTPNGEQTCPLSSAGVVTASVTYNQKGQYVASQISGGLYSGSAVEFDFLVFSANSQVYQAKFVADGNWAVTEYGYNSSGSLVGYDAIDSIPGCPYYNFTPGTWSGPMSWGSPKTLGQTSAPTDPANLPSSPVNPAPTDSNANNGCTSNNQADPMPSCDFGNPINAATGNKVQKETDFTGAASTGLSLVRTYNSQDASFTAFGARWRDEWHRSLTVSGSTVTVTRSDGRQDIFTQNGTAYTADPDVTSTLKAVFSGSIIISYQLTTAADVTESYATTGQLLTITSRAGLVTKLAYILYNGTN